MRTAIVHDWLTGMRGGERCLEALLPLFPDAPIHTLLHHEGAVSPTIEQRPIHTSPVDRWPVPEARYRWMLPFFPWAAEQLDLGGVERVISISHCAAKGVVPPHGATHVSYCLTPMRYAWDQAGTYWDESPFPFAAAPGGALLRAYLRSWDQESSRRVDHFVAPSRFVADRIRRAYGRRAAVIPPPVDCARFRADRPTGEHFLVVSALVPYKRVADAVAAFRQLDLPLIVVGDGPDRRRLESLAGARTTFAGRVDDATLEDLYATCRALVFPGVEDFGLVPVEAMASGRPVIALGMGGVLDSVVPLDDDGANGASPGAPTGILYRRPGAEALASAVRRFLAGADRFVPEDARRRALEFDLPRFQERFAAFLETPASRAAGGRPGGANPRRRRWMGPRRPATLTAVVPANR